MATDSLFGLCARMFMVGFPGKAPTPELASLVSDGVFGAILFTRNVDTAREIANLCRELKRLAGRPFLLAIDQEGGRVARLRGPPFTSLPPMRELARKCTVAEVERAGRLLAFELRAVGFDWDFAPVLDVDTNPENPVIGDRAFHSAPDWVVRYGLALARGLEAGGVASSGKHFPGHGDTHQDSHKVLPRLPHTLERLRQVELPPFAAYAREKLASVMTAHVLFEAVDPVLPATLSPRVLQAVLRQELGFRGVVVSDDLEMKAIADRWGVEEAAVLGALAGVDLFLVCHEATRQRGAIEALVRAVESGRVPKSRILEANQRLDLLAAKFSHGPEDLFSYLGSAEHLALARGLEGDAQGPDPTA